MTLNHFALWRFAGFVSALWFLVIGPALAQQALPILTGHVVDTVSKLTPEQRGALDAKLTAFEQSSGTQVVVLVVASTLPEDIAAYGNRVANAWKIGRKGVGDGLLLIVAVQDRKLRIEVAKTLEGAIPDLAAKRIIDDAITPHFKQGNYGQGLDAGADQIMALIRGEALPSPAKSSVSVIAGNFDWTNLAIFIFFVVPLVGSVARNFLGSKLGSLATGGVTGVIAMLLTSSLILSGMAGLAASLFTLIAGAKGRSGHSGSYSSGSGTGWSSGSGSNSDFGGGFSSGGGGDFGGGGASGDW